MLTNIFFFLSPYHCASVFRCVGVLKHPTSNTHSSLHAADLPGSLSVPPVGWNPSRHSRLQWSVSYHEHFFNSTFNLPGLKTPQTTIWHQPQLLHCSGTEERNMISTLNFLSSILNSGFGNKTCQKFIFICVMWKKETLYINTEREGWRDSFQLVYTETSF